MKVYIIGSLRNQQVPLITEHLRGVFPEHEFFDDWYAAGPEADDKWRDYEKLKGNDPISALSGYAAQHVYTYDRHHLEESDAVVLISPAGKSGHLELGWAIGQGKYSIYYIDPKVERWDVMLNFCDDVVDNLEDLCECLGRLA